MSRPVRLLATAAELLAIPEETRFHEVIAGELVPKTTPSFEHGAAQNKLSAYTDPFHRAARGSAPGGWWFGTEVELELEAHEVYRPDMAGWRHERVPERPGGLPVRTRPDWICEILSPSGPLHDLGTKFDTYQRCGVPHYWVVDPMSERLRVHRWTSEGYLVVLNAHRRQRLRVEPFEAIELEVGVLFGDDEEGTEALSTSVATS